MSCVQLICVKVDGHTELISCHAMLFLQHLSRVRYIAHINLISVYTHTELIGHKTFYPHHPVRLDLHIHHIYCICIKLISVNLHTELIGDRTFPAPFVASYINHTCINLISVCTHTELIGHRTFPAPALPFSSYIYHIYQPNLYDMSHIC